MKLIATIIAACLSTAALAAERQDFGLDLGEFVKRMGAAETKVSIPGACQPASGFCSVRFQQTAESPVSLYFKGASIAGFSYPVSTRSMEDIGKGLKPVLSFLIAVKASEDDKHNLLAYLISADPKNLRAIACCDVSAEVKGQALVMNVAPR